MKIAKIDAHHHLWQLGSPHYPMLTGPDTERYFGNTAGLKQEFGPAEFLPMAAAQNVVKSVYVESAYLPALEETAAVQAIADEFGLPNAIIAHVDPASPSLAADLGIHLRSANFRGVRLTLNWDGNPLRSSVPRDGLMMEPDWRRGFALLCDAGLSTDLLLLTHQLPQAADLARSFSGASIVLNHAALPLDRDQAGLAFWRDNLRRVAENPNVTMKISGIAMATHAWSEAIVAPIVDDLIGIFGAERCMFASNYPVDRLYCSYDAIFDMFDAITAARPLPERQNLFHDTAARIYRI
jgi:predicted TIM-barrel fold metal-dependent hydrolase